LRKYCRQNFNVHNADYKDQPFHPHLTLAFRDLKKPAYAQAWDEFRAKTYNAEFIVEHIVLLKHTGKFWKELHRFALQ
jgi:2'-5' RNA ligase